ARMNRSARTRTARDRSSDGDLCGAPNCTSHLRHHVAQPTSGQDGLLTELSPQAVDRDFDRVALNVGSVVVEKALKLILGHETARVTHQARKDLEFFCGDGNRRSVLRYRAGAEVKAYVPDSEHITYAAITSPDMGPQPSQQFIQVERLDDVVIRARVQ